MKIAVAGLWHLGSVTAACLAKAGHEVIAYDPDSNVIENLINHQPPIYEPGLTALLDAGVTAKHLHYTNDLLDVSRANIVWVTFDTPVDNNDMADTLYVTDQVKKMVSHLAADCLIIISSQLPVGSIALLQEHCSANCPEKNITFACIPENLRLGKAISVFTQPDRIIIGLNNLAYQSQLEELLLPFSSNLIWMSIVSAEMAKHAINAFLAVSVTFINEIAALCETVGANGSDIERALKSEERIGPKAYLRPGDAIAGGTLMRDIHYLMQLGEQRHRQTFLISAIAESNHYHKEWTCRKLTTLLPDLKGKKVAMLGLTYKAGTDTLRRSTAVETCAWLHQQGVSIYAYDPAISQLPDDLANFIHASASISDALHEADAVVISTEWPQFRELTADAFTQHQKQPFILDPNGFIAKNIKTDTQIKYYSVGVPS